MEPNALLVNGSSGDGAYTCTNNAQYQNAMQDFLKEVIEGAIAEKFDMESLVGTSNGTIRIADLGCSVGQNTLIAMQIVVEAMEKKFISSTLQRHSGFKTAPAAPEFHVFFNDLSSNDFNTLFTSLPPDRRYFAAGVPGSFFHGQLFPKSSLDFVLSTYSVTYLSKVPEEVFVQGGGNNPQAARGIRNTTISYSNAPKQVADAYAAQFAKDMGVFLSARADEIAVGGMMIIMTSAAIPDGPHRSQHPGRLSFWCLEQSLIDMVQLGLISESKVDSFKLPFYAVSLDEMRKIVERNGCFSIERMELATPRSKIDAPLTLQDVTAGFRPGFEGILTAHFGSEINMDDLFDRMLRKAAEVYPEMVFSYKNTSDLFVILKRV